jgi:hypothetical protein
MTKRTPALFTLAVCAALLAGLAAPAASSRDEGEHGPIHDHMEKLEDGMKALRRDLKDPAKNESSLALLVGMQDAVQQSKLHAPPLTAKQPEEARAAYVVEYRTQLIALQKDLLDLELALLAGDNATAQALWKQAHDREDPGHEKFTEDG